MQCCNPSAYSHGCQTDDVYERCMEALIRELVDSPCRDGADAQYKQYLSKSRITSPQICQKHIQAPRHPLCQNPHVRQLNAKVCGSESAIFLILSFFLVKTTIKFNNDISHKRFKYSPSF